MKMARERRPASTEGDGRLAQRLRLASGLVLFAFVLTHLLNHAVGIVSLAAMEEVRAVRAAVWESVPGTVLLYGSLAVHAGLALARTARRRTLRMPAIDWAQLALGLAIPFLLIDHAVGTRLVQLVFGIVPDYGHVLALLWPDLALSQTLLVAIVWAHACIGIHQWLRPRPWYPRARPVLSVAALLVPVLATWGWTEAARRQLADGLANGTLTAEAVGFSAAVIGWAHLAWWVAVLAVLGLVASRMTGLFCPSPVEIAYPDGRLVRAAPGPTLLEISHGAGIPHASVCGGRARCSTCRTRILAGGEGLPAPGAAERAVLSRIEAPADVRLACQVRPVANMSVAPLLPARRRAALGSMEGDPYHFGVERPVAILFVDIRGFTAIAESRLPFDVVFLLREYLETMSRTVRANGGYVDKFIGDAVMAIYGMDGAGKGAACREALSTAADMVAALDALNQRLADQLPAPLRIGIGINAGPAILGRFGVEEGGAGRRITALGDTVNTASRLEDLNKERGSTVAVSASVAETAGIALPEEAAVTVRPRGRAGALTAYVFDDGAAFRAALAGDCEPTRAAALT